MDDQTLPKGYDREEADRILELIAEGFTLRELARSILLVPPATFRGWIARDVDGLAQRHADARALQAEAWADEIREIAADGTNDLVTYTLRNGERVQRTNYEVVARAKLRIDTTRWLMAKFNPARFAELLSVKQSGEVAKTIRHEYHFSITAEPHDATNDGNGDGVGGANGGRLSAAALGAN